MTQGNASYSQEQQGHGLKVLIIALTFLAPFAFSISQSEGWHYYKVAGVLWMYTDYWFNSEDAFSGFYVMPLYSIFSIALYSSIRFLFAFFVIRHLQGLGSMRYVWLSGILSQVPVSFFYLPYILGLVENPATTLSFGGPIPILLVVGLIAAHYRGSEPLTEPWSEGTPISHS